MEEEGRARGELAAIPHQASNWRASGIDHNRLYGGEGEYHQRWDQLIDGAFIQQGVRLYGGAYRATKTGMLVGANVETERWTTRGH